MNLDPPSRLHIVCLGAAVEGGLALLALFLGAVFNQPPFDSISVEWASLGRGLLATLPLLIFFLLFTRWPIGPLRPIKRFSDDVVRPLFATCTIGDLALIAFLAGAGEEMLFRAVLQPIAVHYFGVWTGILAVSVLFGLMHFITPTYAILATVAGVYLGVLSWLSGNVMDAVIAHALYDFVALWWIVFGRADDSVPQNE